MTLSIRLKAVADLVDENKVVADIGCDHALLSIYLVENKISNKVYAIDNKKGPLAKANENISIARLNAQITTILDDGLTHLPEDVNVAVMAGIGGLLATQMLEKASRLPEIIIIQANNHLKELREYLSLKGFEIINECILFDSGLYYEIIKVKRGLQTLSFEDMMFGPVLRKEKSKLFYEKWNKQLEHLEHIYEKNKDSDKLDELVNNIELIKKEIK
ncbi:MAG: SAM-dependent methyltransferase [Bacilli bacterium]|nr:SAM-dependent methyltransferase [Bacilli bacterium]